MKYEVTFLATSTDSRGNAKKIRPLYLVSAYSVIEAVTKASEAISGYYAEYECISCKQVKYEDVVTNNEDKFYRVKENIITIDERTAEEKRSPLLTIYQASDINAARKYLEIETKGSPVDREVVSISETKIIDYIE